MKGQFPWIGRSRGSAGGMTTAKINDKNVMRAKAFEVTNPKTAAQVMQRNFFKDVQDVCASVTEDQLRSLFGIKPKTMTRRNALSKQIAAAYTIADGMKSVDFSKLGAIGNGLKVNTEISIVEDGNVLSMEEYTPAMFGLQTFENTNIILVVFDTTSNSIKIMNLEEVYEEGATFTEIVGPIDESINGFCYATCSSDGSNVFNKGFGSFIIKTRATD